MSPSEVSRLPKPHALYDGTSLSVLSRTSVPSRSSLKRSYFSLNFLSDFIEKNSRLGAFRRLSPRLPLGQKHLFTRCPVSTRWGPGLRTGKEETGGPRERAGAQTGDGERHTHPRARARAHSPTLPLAHAPPGAALAPRPPARTPELRPEPLPHWRAEWGRGGGEAKVTPRRRRGLGSCSREPQGASARLPGATGRRGLGGERSGGFGTRVSGMERWGAERSGAAPALQLEFQMSSSFQIGAALY